MAFLEDLRNAMSTSDQFDYISEVKRVVHRELESLDPTAHVADTKYFNHSSVPDFVVSWPGERGERRIYLRDSYESIVAARDDSYLIAGDPVLVSLEQAEFGRDEPHDKDSTQRQLAPTDRMLVTDVDAIEEFAVANDQDGSSPLSQMVRANFVRGARGEVDKATARTLVSANLSSEATAEERRAVIESSFFPDAAFRITRTATLIDAALSPEVAEPNGLVGNLQGKLSRAEIRHVLPWLLAQRAGSVAPDFWRQLGSMMSFADLEKVKDVLNEDIDITALVEANADRWSAKWAYVGVSTPIHGEADLELRRNYWSFVRGSLGIDLGDRRLILANNGQLLPKSRRDVGSIDWLEAQASLRAARLARVDLSGVRRSIIVTAEQSPDVRADVDEVTQSLSDSYRVTELTIRVDRIDGEEGPAEIALNFGSGLAQASEGVAMGVLASATVSVLARGVSGLAEGVTAAIRTSMFTGESEAPA